MMKARRLTDVGVERVRANGGREEVPDTLVPGLRLIVQPSGRKSWAMRYRLAGKTAKFTIGSYPAWSLEDARRAAREAGKFIGRGRHPLQAKKQQQADTVGTAIQEWLDTDQADNRSRDNVKQMTELDVLPKWGDVPIASIAPEDCDDILAPIVERGSVTKARRVHAHLHRLFRWAVLKRKVTVNPFDAVEKPGREVVRDRVLSDAELGRVWNASDQLGYPFGPMYKLLILTGARLREILNLRWSEVDWDEAMIRLEGARTKNGKSHLIPLAPAALKILSDLPRIGEVYCFTTNAETPSSGVTKSRRRLDRFIGEIEPWTTHDLRRSFVTRANELALAPPHVIEAHVGHASGFRAGVAGTYNHALYLPERVALAKAWGRHMLSTVNSIS